MHNMLQNWSKSYADCRRVKTNLELLPLLVELLARDGAHLLEVDEAALEDV